MVLATHNIDKRKELKAVLGNLAVNILTLDDFPQIGEIEESGNSLLENSMIKAKTVHNLTGLPAIADDTGLEVDALDGAPGIFSARYAGENATYDDNISKLLEELKEIPPAARTAVFRTIVSFVDTDRELWTEGAIKGMIIDEAHGKNGFGYDPVFFIPGLDKTFAELSAEEKNKISHRGLALKKIRKLLAEEIIH